MQYKIASIICACYAVIGFILTANSADSNVQNLLLLGCLFSVIPAYGAYGTWRRNRFALLAMAGYFLLQTVRFIQSDYLLFHFTPISIAVPVGDFSQSKGILIDFFSIFMGLYYILLFQIRNKGTYD